MIQEVDHYIEAGCGRCEYYDTPKCKVNSWRSELIELRRIVLDCGLMEEFKWSQPCYTLKGKNVLIVTAFKDYACVAFFKGTLLKDSKNILISPGKNSQSNKRFPFRSVEQVLELEPIIKAYIFEAIEVEKAGLKVDFKKEPEPIPEELKDFLDRDNELKKAFESLTPGRQRGYILHFSQPKQSQTRISRIEKCIPKILIGKGFHDR